MDYVVDSIEISKREGDEYTVIDIIPGDEFKQLGNIVDYLAGKSTKDTEYRVRPVIKNSRVGTMYGEYSTVFVPGMLPGHTLRFLFSKASVVPETPEGYGGTWTKVEGASGNVWDWFNVSTDWSAWGDDIENRPYLDYYDYNDEDEYIDIIDSNLGPYETDDETSGGPIVVMPVLRFNDTFAGNKYLRKVVLKHTDCVETMTGTFAGCENLEEINDFACDSLITLGGCFTNSGITTLRLSDTPNLRNIAGLFGTGYYSYSKIREVEIPFAPLLDNASFAFSRCGFLEHANIGIIKSKENINLDSMFAYCENLTHVSLGDTSNATNMRYMFNGCGKLHTIEGIYLDSAYALDSFMYGCESMTELPDFNYIEKLPDEYESYIVGFNSMFSGMVSVTGGMLREYTKMAENPIIRSHDYSLIFNECGYNSYTEVYASDNARIERQSIPTTWGGDLELPVDLPPNTFLIRMIDMPAQIEHDIDTMRSRGIEVTQMEGNSLYYYATVPQNCTGAFRECTSIGSFEMAADTMNITHAADMFNGCTNLRTVCYIDVDEVSDLSGMFANCSNLIELAGINTGSATNMHYMFLNCSEITQIPWMYMGDVTDMSSMCSKCYKLRYIDFYGNLNSLTTVYGAFYRCYSIEYGMVNFYDTVQEVMKETGRTIEHSYVFEDCGIDSPEGIYERDYIPDDWK